MRRRIHEEGKAAAEEMRCPRIPSPSRRSPIRPTRLENLSVHRNEHWSRSWRRASIVFTWPARPEERLRWMGALIESEPLDDKPPALGSRFRDVFQDHGQRIELEAELVAFEPPQALAVRLVADASRRRAALGSRKPPWNAAHRHDRDDLQGFRRSGSWRRSSRQAQKQLEADLDRLKELVEAGAALPGA